MTLNRHTNAHILHGLRNPITPELFISHPVFAGDTGDTDRAFRSQSLLSSEDDDDQPETSGIRAEHLNFCLATSLTT